jgi:glycerol-3-phosphate dehydrogenase
LMDDGDVENASAVSRDYELKIDAVDGQVPLLTVMGGKLTTYRKLAESALDDLASFCINLPAGWTDKEPLNGGDIPQGWHGFTAWQTAFIQQYPQLDPKFLANITRRYGTLTSEVIGDAQSMADLGQYFGGGLYEAEVHYLRRVEWAWQAEDVLWRRTKCGLHMTEAERALFKGWFDSLPTPQAA